MKKAQKYSVMLDTTQNIAANDQYSIVIRYVGNHSVHERLFSFVNCTNTTGQGICQSLILFKLFAENFNTIPMSKILD